MDSKKKLLRQKNTEYKKVNKNCSYYGNTTFLLFHSSRLDKFLNSARIPHNHRQWSTLAGISPPTTLSPLLKTLAKPLWRTKGAVGGTVILYHQALTWPLAATTATVPTCLVSILIVKKCACSRCGPPRSWSSFHEANLWYIYFYFLKTA